MPYGLNVRSWVLRVCVAISALMVLGLLTACPKRQVVDSEDKGVELKAGEKLATMPSGATMKVPTEWKVEKKEDGLVLTGPEGKLVIELVEFTGAKDTEEAIRTGISKRWKDFSRELRASEKSPGREGFDESRWANYKTSPEENRSVYAWAGRAGDLYIVFLMDVPLDHYQRRRSQVALMGDSLMPAGHEKETYEGREPAKLDDAKVTEIKTFIEKAMKVADVPGLSIILFENEKTVLEAGFGVRELGKPEPVTPDTLFLIASNTKPLTTLLLAKMVDEGKFTWDTPVTQVYPDFRLGDEETTKKVLMKHLVCACTGLPRQDFEWLFTFEDSSPEDQMKILAGMQPTTDFGALFQYSNPMASAAGYIGARLAFPDEKLGPAYDKAMREKVFEPLGMKRTTFSFDEALAADHAKPHSFDMTLKSVPIGPEMNRSVLPVRPAGGAWSSVKDYAKYVRMELAKGLLPDGSRYIGEAGLMERRKDQVRVSEDEWYAMGLGLRDTKAIRTVVHGGSLFGMKSDFFFVPSTGLGGVIFTNSDTGYRAVGAIVKRIMELVYEGKPEAEEDLESSMRSLREYYTKEHKDWQIPPDQSAVKRLAKKYASKVLGDISISLDGAKVIFDVGGWKSEMATKVNPDGSTSFMTTSPGFTGFEFNAPKGEEPIKTLTVRDPQHKYHFEAVE